MKARMAILLVVVLALVGYRVYLSMDNRPQEREERQINAAAVQEVYDRGWLVSYDEAVAASEETGKPIFAVFVGTDWSERSERQTMIVFRDGGFEAWADERVVRLVLDYPREQPQEPNLAEQNARLLEEYGLTEDDLPAMLVLDSDGSERGRIGPISLPPSVPAWVQSASAVIEGEEEVPEQPVRTEAGAGGPGGGR